MKVSDGLSPELGSALLAKSIQGVVDGYIASNPPAIVRAIDSPGVTWVWIGAILIALGGLISLSQPSVARSRQRAAALARIGRELGPA